ncbi:hypothetical protein BX070DRAFT_253766 [Coemansia spiralis]|nr:hypothetical protein BX070DRAFT_253766 [Coemansia spiralis]
MVKIQLSALDEFITSLSKQDYEGAKIASGKVMEDHIQMGALMFSLLTIEMMYTSMDYLAPGNFQRGNGYMLNMYNSLPRRLQRLHKKLACEYHEEYQQLMSTITQPMQRNSATHTSPSQQFIGTSLKTGVQLSKHDASQIAGRPISAMSAFRPVNEPVKSSKQRATGGASTSSSVWRDSDHGSRPRSEHQNSQRQQQPDAGASEPFDAKRYLNNMEKAEKVLEDQAAVALFVDFITKFIDIRKTMVVLYRFVAVTGPVLYVQKLEIMLERCRKRIESIPPNPLYQRLLDNVRSEVWLVCSIVVWDSHVMAYNFVKAVTSMKQTKALLKSWQSALPDYNNTHTAGVAMAAAKAQFRAAEDALGPARTSRSGSIYDSLTDTFALRRSRDGPQNTGDSSHGLLYSAFTKSSRLVQNLLWGGNNASSLEDSPESRNGGIRGVVKWLDCWVGFLSFKTTTYFQQIIAPYRSLHYEDMTSQARQTAVMNDIWSRPGISKTNLGEMLRNFMIKNDACFVSLLFESSKKHPFAADGFALGGTKLKVSDYRVQACALLFCLANEKLMQMRGRALKESIIHDVHSTKPGPTERTAANASLQSDSEWFRQNCLPDILYILDSDRDTLDYELLGSSPLVSQLGANSDELLVELSNSVHGVIDESVASVLSMQENTDDVQSVLEHSLESIEYIHDDTDSNKYNEDFEKNIDGHPAATNEQNHEESVANEAVHTGDSLTDAENNYNASDDKENLNLYSTYLLKSHLRNNLQNDGHFRSGHGNKRFAGRQPGQTAAQGKQYKQSADTSAVSVDNAKNNEQSAVKRQEQNANQAEARVAANDRRVNVRDMQMSSAAILQRSRTSAADLPTVVSLGDTSRRRVVSTSGMSENIPNHLRDTGRSRISSVQDASAHSSQTGRRSANTISSSNTRRARATPSIRSFFNTSLLLGMAANQTALHEQKSPEEGEVAKRVRRGERLRELFGSWNMRDDDASEDAIAFLGRDTRRSSIHSLSFSTSTRISLGPRSSVSAAALGGTLGAMQSADVGSAGLSYRLSRATTSANPAATMTGTLADSDAPRRTGEGVSTSTLDQLRRFSQLHYQQSTHVPHVRPPPPSHSVVDAAAGGSEGYTYLYARVGLPNVVMVAVFLDTERGLGRRRDAEHAWDKIVDAVRGMPLFEQMMALAN